MNLFIFHDEQAVRFENFVLLAISLGYAASIDLSPVSLFSSTQTFGLEDTCAFVETCGHHLLVERWINVWHSWRQLLHPAAGLLQCASERKAQLVSDVTRLEAERVLVATQSPVASHVTHTDGPGDSKADNVGDPD